MRGARTGSAEPGARTQRGAGDGRPPDPRRWWALAVIDLCLLAIMTDNTILNVALPSIARELGATGAQLQWMVDAYIVAFAGLLLTSGTLGDRLGRRRLMLAGLTLFGLASAATSFVGSADQLILVRGTMGLGAALLMPATLSLITNIFPDEERPKAIASWSAVTGLGMVVGPIVGGALLEAFRWNAVFLVNVPIALIGLLGTAHLVPESRDENPGRTDPIGALLSIVALATLVFGIISAPSDGWAAPITLARIAAGLALLATFVLWELHYSAPMFDIRLFARPAFGATSFAETIAHFALVGAMFGLTQYLQFVWGLRPLQAGMSLVPIAVGVVIGSVVAARLQARVGARRLVVAGLASMTVSVALIALLAVDSAYPAFAAVLVFMSLGMGLAMAPATDSIMGAVEKARAGVGSATNDTTRELGSALGVAILGSILSSGYRDAVVSRLGALPGGIAALPPAAAAAIQDSIGSATVAAGALPGALGGQVLDAVRAAYVSGMSAMAAAGAIALAAGVVILLHWLPQPSSEPRTADADASDAPGRTGIRPSDANALS